MAFFDEARKRAKDRIAGPEAEAEIPEEEPAEEAEGAPEDVPEEIAEELPEDDMTTAEGEALAGEAAEEAPEEAPAEVPAGPSPEEFAQLQEANRQLAEQNEKLQEWVREMSKGNEEAATEELATPEIDWGSLMYEDEESARGKVDAYRAAVEADARRAAQAEIMAKMRPALEDIEAQKAAMAHKKMMDDFGADPRLPGYAGMSPYLEAFVKENPNLYGNVSPEEAYINAYLAKRGYDALHAPAPAEPTDEEIMAYYEKRPSLKAAIEERRIKELGESGGEKVPVFAPSQGVGGAAVELDKKPQNMDEASKLARKRWRNS